jgi:hypothetical protein
MLSLEVKDLCLVCQDQDGLEFTHFFVNILIFLGSAPCVTKGKWENGKMESKERQIDFLVFLPFFPAFPFFLILHVTPACLPAILLGGLPT